MVASELLVGDTITVDLLDGTQVEARIADLPFDFSALQIDSAV